jgi:hypothetical protein
VRKFKVFLVAMAVTLVVSASSAARLFAQAAKPAVVVSIASLNETMADVQYITQAAGLAQYGQLAQFATAQYANVLDKTKPLGLVVYLDTGAPRAIGFIPISNLQAVLALVQQQVGQPRDAGNGIKQLPGPGGNSVFLKDANGYLFLSDSAENLANLPANPATLLGGMEAKYNLAVTVNASSIPEPLKSMAVDQLRAGFQMQLQMIPDQEQRNLQEKLNESSLKQMEQLLTQSEQMTFGWAIDATTKSTYIDVNFTAKPGTELATQLAQMANLKTNFAGFALPEAAGLMTFTGVVAEKDKAQMAMTFDALKQQALNQLENDADLPSDDARTAAKDVLDSFFDVFEGTIQEGVMDGGAVLKLDTGTVQFVAGGHVADGQALDAAFKKLIELAQADPEVPEVKMNADQHGDVVFHTMSVPVPDEDAQLAFGETLEVALGTGPKSFFIAVGKDSVALVKRIIDDSAKQAGKATVPAQFIVTLTPIIRFASEIAADENLAAVLQALEQSQGKDHVSIVVRPNQNGFSYRIELEEGVIRAIGGAVSAQIEGGF